MVSQTEKVTTRFQRLLKEPKLLLMPGGFSPVAARMVEVDGLDSFFLAGSQVSAQILGLPDVGLMGREEMTQATQRVTTACNIPILVDADTGYGNALSVYHAVQGFIRAGASRHEHRGPGIAQALWRWHWSPLHLPGRCHR